MNMYDTEDTVVAGKTRFVYGVQQFRIEIRNPDYNFSVTFFLGEMRDDIIQNENVSLFTDLIGFSFVIIL
jgi:hypothetical protein